MNNHELQSWLNKLADIGTKLAVDGFFGPKTEKVAKAVIAARKVRAIIKDPKIAIEQLVYKEVAKLPTGPIDGILGPATRKAREIWTRGEWRNIPLLADGVSPVEDKKKRWPEYKDLREFYGPPGTGQTYFNTPFPMKLAWRPYTKIRRFTCHEKVAGSLSRVYTQIADEYSRREIELLRIDYFAGCSNYRKIRGGKNLSTHSWGIAVDTDSARNSLRMTSDQARLARPEYKKFWSAWENEGWTSLGKERNFDWMHVQACRL